MARHAKKARKSSKTKSAYSYLFGESKPRKKRSSRATRAVSRGRKAYKKATRKSKPFKYHI